MKRHFLHAAICAAFVLSAIPAKADFMATASIDAAQELNPLTNAPPVSPATGSFTLDFNAAANSLTYTLMYSGLTSSTTMAHIHLGPPGQSGAPLFTLYDYGMPPSVNMTSDTLSGTLTAADFMPDSVDGIATFAQAVAQIQDDNTYVNIHTTNYPAGEIRGQILLSNTGGMDAPEPAALDLFALGVLLGGFGVWRRRSLI